MVRLLETRHGLYAADMADFFVTRNALSGDAERASKWADVASRIRLRRRLRLLATDGTPD